MQRLLTTHVTLWPELPFIQKEDVVKIHSFHSAYNICQSWDILADWQDSKSRFILILKWSPVLMAPTHDLKCPLHTKKEKSLGISWTFLTKSSETQWTDGFNIHSCSTMWPGSTSKFNFSLCLRYSWKIIDCAPPHVLSGSIPQEGNSLTPHI